MKLLTKHGLYLAIALGAAACSRNNIEAVNLANDGIRPRGRTLTRRSRNTSRRLARPDEPPHPLEARARVLEEGSVGQGRADVRARGEAGAGFPNYWYMQGHALLEQAKKGSISWLEAKEPLKTSISKDPNYADAYEDLAEVNVHTDDEQEALRNYAKAIETKPDNLSFYVPYADLLNNLGYADSRRTSSRRGCSTRTGRRRRSSTCTLFSAASTRARGTRRERSPSTNRRRKSCGQCNEPGQPIAYFNVGAAYATASPPRKSEAMSALQAFQKIVCKGAAASRYADQCATAQQYATKLGGMLQ